MRQGGNEVTGDIGWALPFSWKLLAALPREQGVEGSSPFLRAVMLAQSWPHHSVGQWECVLCLVSWSAAALSLWGP